MVGAPGATDGHSPALLAVAGVGLAHASRPAPPEPLGAAGWEALLAGAGRHRLTGQLAAATASGVLPATPDQCREARAAHRRTQIRVLALERELARVVGLLAADGIDCRALKGSAVAHLDYADPALRSFVDLDLLVRAEDIERTVATMGRAGFRRTLAEPRPGFDRRFDKGMTLRGSADYEIDLHRMFVLGPWGALMDPRELWDDRDEFSIGGCPIPALSAPYRFVHACYHAALGDWPLRLSSLRDVAEMLPRTEGRADTVRRIAARWSSEAVVATAVAQTCRLLALDTDVALARWAEGYVPGRRDRAWLALHNTPDKTFAAQALATLGVLPRWRDKAAYVRALALPSDAYTAGRHRSVWSRLGYALDELRRGSRRRP